MPPAPSSRDPAAHLPPPTADARANSARVTAHVAQMIAAAGGWISFADYMGAALYAPGLGYYVAGARKFGADGDFITAPELTPLFGRALASQLAEVLKRVSDGVLIELGPGSGQLAADLLEALAGRDAMPARCCLLEVSPELRERQRAQLQARVAELMPRIEWIDALPQRWSGVVVANEVLDAIPPHLVARAGGQWLERGVAIDSRGAFCFEDRPLKQGPLQDSAEARFPRQGDYLSEINAAAPALVRALAQRCESGAMLIIDYGFPAREYYHLQRDTGTLMTHYRHRVLDDPFLWPGLADLTAHVDFTDIAHAAVSGGMTLAGYASQARFLVNCGILDELAACADIQSIAYLREAAAVQKLLSPSEMGELFKVMALTRGIDDRLLGFTDGDQSHRL